MDNSKKAMEISGLFFPPKSLQNAALATYIELALDNKDRDIARSNILGSMPQPTPTDEDMTIRVKNLLWDRMGIVDETVDDLARMVIAEVRRG